MIDTIFPHNTNIFLMTRFLSSDLKLWTVLDGDERIYDNIIKASKADYINYCQSKPARGLTLAILSAQINIMGKYEIHQYIVWRDKDKHFLAATLLNGSEEFQIK